MDADPTATTTAATMTTAIDPQQDQDDDGRLPRHRRGSLPAVLYKECVKNMNTDSGGPVHDGCREFDPVGKPGSADALRCSVCGCHRNFHQQESGERPNFHQVATDIRQLAKKSKRSTVAEVLENIATLVGLLAKEARTQAQVLGPVPVSVPVPVPVPVDGGAAKSDGDGDVKESKQISGDEEVLLPGKDDSPDDQPKKKRNRTIFSHSQLGKLETLAENASWSLGNIPKEQQASAAAEIGISVESLKYWFHNTKQKKKKPARKSA